MYNYDDKDNSFITFKKRAKIRNCFDFIYFFLRKPIFITKKMICGIMKKNI
jgi:hypothetical protein